MNSNSLVLSQATIRTVTLVSVSTCITDQTLDIMIKEGVVVTIVIVFLNKYLVSFDAGVHFSGHVRKTVLIICSWRPIESAEFQKSLKKAATLSVVHSYKLLLSSV